MLMKYCPNCYDHKYNNFNDWMIRACEQPHLILWVDIRRLDFWPANKGFNFWPAKVLAVAASGDDSNPNQNSNQNLRIVFFGHHEFATVDACDCYLYSGQNPNPVNLTSDPRDIAGALEVKHLF